MNFAGNRYILIWVAQAWYTKQNNVDGDNQKGSYQYYNYVAIYLIHQDQAWRKIPAIEWTASGTPNSHSTASLSLWLRFYTSSQGWDRKEFPLLKRLKKKKKEDGAWVSEGQLTSCFICHWIFRPPSVSLAATKGADKSQRVLSLWYRALWRGEVRKLQQCATCSVA